MTERVLVAYGSERGGTEGIAEAIGAALREDGLDVDVCPVSDVRELTPYGAVVLGGSLYMGRWHIDARRFGRLHALGLRERDVWLFSSGPLDDSADQKEIPPVKAARELAARIRANGHATFGGRLEPDTKGFVARSMARKLGGEFRNFERIEKWAHEIAQDLGPAGAASDRGGGRLSSLA